MSPSPLFLPDHLIHEVLTFFPVKSLMRLKCVSKSWNTLISDPIFVKLHLQRSLRNRNLLLTYRDHEDLRFIPLSISRLLDNTPITLSSHRLKYNDCQQVIGSCNGLICLVHYSRSLVEFKNVWFRLWNPATGTISNILGSFHKPRSHVLPRTLGYTFGYDNSTDTYKIVAFGDTWVRLFCLTYNVWREIQCLPAKVVIAAHHDHDKSVYLNGTLNWFAFLNKFPYIDFRYKDTLSVVRYLILSLDLGTETFKELLPPPVFDEGSDVFDPTISVLMDCLCFSYHFKDTHFVVWQMTQFGVEQSWTQLFKISYVNLQVEDKINEPFCSLYLLYLSAKDDKLILACSYQDQAIIYNLRDNTVERTRITNKIHWYLFEGYVESLVPTS